MDIEHAARGIIGRYGAPCAVLDLRTKRPIAQVTGYLTPLRRQDLRLRSETESAYGAEDTGRYLLITPPIDGVPALSQEHLVEIHGGLYHPRASDPIRFRGRIVYLRSVVGRYHEREGES